MRGKRSKGEGGLLLLKTFFNNCLKKFFGDHVVETSVEMIEVEGGITIFSSKHSGNCDVLEFVVEDGPLVTKSDHVFDTFFTFLLERYGDGGLGRGVQCLCIVWTGYLPLFLLWGWKDWDW